MKIVDYNKKMSIDMNRLEDDYWGLEEGETLEDEFDSNSLIKVALDEEDRVVGFCHAQLIGDLLEIHNILVSDCHQRVGIGSQLLAAVLKIAKEKGAKNSIANAVNVRGESVNAERILKKFGYRELYRVQNYWDAIYPNYYCKQCKSRSCHCGTVVYLKNL